MKTTAEATYLGQPSSWPRWTDDTRLPVLLGFDDEGDADDEEHEEHEQDDGDEEHEGEEEPPKKALRPERQARYRVERNAARAERDDLRMEVAFQRAAGSQFVDAEAAWKLADRSLLTVADEGTVPAPRRLWRR